MRLNRNQFHTNRSVAFTAGMIFGITLVIAGGTTVAQPPIESTNWNKQANRRMQGLLSASKSKTEAPAFWAGVFRVENHKIVDAASTTYCTGVRKFGSEDEVSIDDLIHLGSCTKAMTATLVAQAISQSTATDDAPLKFESTLAEIFPDMESLTSSKWATVTIQELLSHRSGVPENAEWFELETKFPNDPIRSRQALLEWLVTQERPSRPKFEYSNVGYALLGHVLEQRTGKSWEEIIQEELFPKLKITSAGFGPVKGEKDLDQPWGHYTEESIAGALGRGIGSLFGGKKELQWESIQIDNPVPLGPAGRCHMRFEDWAKFVALFADKSVDPRLNIDQSTWSKLLDVTGQSSGLPYAGGWIIVGNKSDSDFRLNHAGSNTTWYCIADVFPNRGEFTLVVSNCSSDMVAAECDNLLDELSKLHTQANAP